MKGAELVPGATHRVDLHHAGALAHPRANRRRGSPPRVAAAIATEVAAPIRAMLGGVDVQAVSALLAALLILAIGASVVLRSRKDRMYTSFAAFTFIVSAWHLCTFLDAATDSPVMRWLAMWSAATIPPLAIRFFRIFLAQPSIGGPNRGPRVTLAWTLLAYAGLIVSAIYKRIHDEPLFQIPFGIYVFGGLYRCVYDLWVQYRATTKRVERKRVGYLALGGFVATTLTLTDVLPRFDIAWPAVGNVLGILYLYFLSQSLFRNRLIDLNELLGKMAVLGSLVVLLSAVYGSLLYWIGGGQKDLYLLNALVAAFVILILFEPVRNWLETTINRWLLRQRTELRGRLDTVRRELPGVVDVPDMVQRIMTAIEESRRVTDAALYLLDPLRVKPLVTPTAEVYYELKSDNMAGLEAENVVVPASEIIHDRMNCLFHPLLGVGPIFACASRRSRLAVSAA